MKEQPNFYAIIPASVRYDKRLSSSEKLFYAEITAMSNKEGFCWASNSYFSELFGVSNSTISSWVTGLKSANHIKVEYEREGKNIRKRIIYPIQKIGIPYSENRHTPIQKIGIPYSENPKENTTSINITSNNIEENEAIASSSQNASDLKEATKLAEMLLEHIINWDATHRYVKNPPAINGWIKDIDRAMRLDGRTYEQLEFIIKYIFTQNTEKARFWAINIESGKKLRLQFDTIKHQIINERKKNEQQRYIDNAQRNRAMVESLFD